MHRRGNDNALMHLDFTAIDLLAMQISCIIMYWVTGHGGIIYYDPEYRLLAIIFLVCQVSLGLFSDNHVGVLTRDAHDEFMKLLLYTFELWICCGLFVFFSRIAVTPFELILVTFFFVDLDYLGRAFNKFLHRKFVTERRKVVVITSSDQVRRAVERINNSKTETEHQIVSICVTDDVDLIRFADLKIPVYYANDPDLLDHMNKMWIDDAFFLVGARPAAINTLIEDFIIMGVTVHYSLAALNDFASVSTDVQSLGDYKVITNSVQLISYRAEFTKRAMDIAAGLAGVIVTGILVVFIGPIIYIKSPGPIFFKQKRVGQNGQIFYMYKFRSMYMDAEKRKAELMAKNKVQDGMMFKMDDDPRIIGSEKKDKNGKPKGIGNFIRNTSLDEFPQFLNVLKGDMSFVGTRPPTVDEWEKYAPHHRARMAVKPGITGMWQVSGRSKITDFEEVIMLDRKYLENWSIKLDIEIVLRTIMVVLKREGAS